MIGLRKIKIINYKSIKALVFSVRENTVLIGKNNSGKSAILEAIKLGMNYESIKKDEIYQTIEDSFSPEKKVIIELLFSPINDRGEFISDFEDDWALALGNRIQFGEEQFFAFQTILEYSKEKNSYLNTKKIIQVWNDFPYAESQTDKKLQRDDLERIFTLYIDARRDLSNDIYDKQSRWAKITSAIEFTPTDTEDILKKIEKINKKVISSNSILKEISKNLKNSTSDSESDITISPIARDLSHLNKGMNIYYNNDLIENIAVEQLGLGVRSWGVFSVLKAYLESEKKRRLETGNVFHSIILVEEPEAHLHPQAQRHLLKEVYNISGQKIITTHSSHILSKVDLSNIILVKKNKTDTSITSLITETLTADELRNIKNKIMNTQAEMLYANSVILCEGETEAIMLPLLFEKYFGKHPFEMGISIISADGSGMFKYFVKLLDTMNIQWFLFSDGEEAVVNGLSGALTSAGYTVDINTMYNVFIIPNEKCIEYHLIEQGYTNEIKSGILDYEADRNFTNNQKRILQGQIRKTKNAKMIDKINFALYETRDYTIHDGDKHLLFDLFVTDKTKYSELIAKKICESRKGLPRIIKALFDKVKEYYEEG